MASDTVGKDPSMDEILQSIKRIISEESDGVGKQEDDILELTDMVHDDGSVVSLIGGEGSENFHSAGEVEGVDAFNSSAESEPDPVQEAFPIPSENKDLLDDIDDSIAASAKVEEQSVQPNEPEPYEEPVVNVAPQGGESKAPSEPDVISALVSDVVAVSAMDKINQFAERVDAVHAVGGTDPLKFRAGTTVEDLVVEAIKPMLSSWLDLNLNQIVESVIERELRRITGR